MKEVLFKKYEPQEAEKKHFYDPQEAK